MRDSVGDPRRAREFALLLGEGAKYPRLMARYVETMLEPRREVIRSVLRRGVATGELRPDTDIEVALFMLTGAVLARGKYDPGSMPPGYVERVVGELRLGLAPRYHGGMTTPDPAPAPRWLAQRLAAQLLSGPPAEGTAQVAGQLLAVQAQDQRGARLAVRARSRARSAADVDDALTRDRSVVVTWL